MLRTLWAAIAIAVLYTTSTRAAGQAPNQEIEFPPLQKIRGN